MNNGASSIRRNHVRTEGRDGNGFAGGVRLSWAALAVFIAAAGLSFTVANVVHSRDAKAIEKIDAKLDKLDEKLDTTLLRLEAHCANPHAHSIPTGP